MLAFCPCLDISCIDPMETDLACFIGWQGGGLFIEGTATLINTSVHSNVHENTAASEGYNVFVDDVGQFTVSHLTDLTGVKGSVTVLAPPPADPPPLPEKSDLLISTAPPVSVGVGSFLQKVQRERGKRQESDEGGGHGLDRLDDDAKIFSRFGMFLLYHKFVIYSHVYRARE